MKRIGNLFFVVILAFAKLASGKEVNSKKDLKSQKKNDLTIESGQSGEEVVDATLVKISYISESVGLQNDFGFLKRIALVENNFGRGNPAYPLGGIWQINRRIERAIEGRTPLPASALDLVNIAGQYFGKEMVNFRSKNFNIPLRSALAARVFIEMQLGTDDFPATIEQQANWWATVYRDPPRNASIFVDAVQEFEELSPCTVSTMDLWFLIDGSGSIGEENFRTCLEFVNKTASEFVIAPERVRTGLMIYSDFNLPRSYLNEHQSNEEFSDIVLSTPYTGGGTVTGSAINAIHELGFSEVNGARPRTELVPRVLLVLTDGHSSDSVVKPSEEIQQDGVTVFGVGVGQGYNVIEINQIANDPDSLYAFELEDFALLSSVLRAEVANQACFVVAEIPPGEQLSITYQPGSVSYSQVELPENGSLELSFEVRNTSSTGIVYVSVTYTNPGPALHDASFEVLLGITVVFYNVDPRQTNQGPEETRKKRQADPSSRPTHLYMAFVTQGTEPINLEFMATTRNETVEVDSTPVATATPSTVRNETVDPTTTPDPTTMRTESETSGQEPETTVSPAIMRTESETASQEPATTPSPITIRTESESSGQEPSTTSISTTMRTESKTVGQEPATSPSSTTMETESGTVGQEPTTTLEPTTMRDETVDQEPAITPTPTAIETTSGFKVLKGNAVMFSTIFFILLAIIFV